MTYGARDFADTHQLAADLATGVMTIDQVPGIAMSRRTPRVFSGVFKERMTERL